jgi:predicted PurR-regulated permease PerM
MQESRPVNRLDYIYKILVVLGILTAAAVLAREIVIPIAFAIFLSIVLLPLVTWLEKKGITSTLSISLVLFATIIIIGLLLWLLIKQIIALANDLPNLQSQFENYVSQASVMLEDQFGVNASDQKTMLADLMRYFSSLVGDLVLSTTNTISTLVQIPIYIFLFLIYRGKFREFLLNLIPENEDSQWRGDMKRVIHGYIYGLTLVTIIVATLNTIGLLALGINHAIFFGVLSGILTIIPYVGIFIGAAFPIIMALITKDSIWYAAGVVILFSVVQFLEGNFITPRITGSKVSINALAAIIALLIGGKILGIAGMILAVPAIGTLKILLAHSAHLKPFVLLLEDTNEKEIPRKGIMLKRILRKKPKK